MLTMTGMDAHVRCTVKHVESGKAHDVCRIRGENYNYCNLHLHAIAKSLAVFRLDQLFKCTIMILFILIDSLSNLNTL